MRNNSYAPHYAISRYSIREFKTGADPFMVAMIIIIIIISLKTILAPGLNVEVITNTLQLHRDVGKLSQK